MGSRRSTLGSSESLGFACVPTSAPRRGRLHSGSRRFTRLPLGVVIFIRVRVGTHAVLGVVGFIRVLVGSLGSAWGLSASFGFPRVLSGARRGQRVHSVSRGFPFSRLAVVGLICVRMSSLGGAPGSL